MGFDAGDGINYYVYNASQTPDIINITSMSNIGVPGIFVFRIDSSAVLEGGRNINGNTEI